MFQQCTETETISKQSVSLQIILVCVNLNKLSGTHLYFRSVWHPVADFYNSWTCEEVLVLQALNLPVKYFTEYTLIQLLHKITNHLNLFTYGRIPFFLLTSVVAFIYYFVLLFQSHLLQNNSIFLITLPWFSQNLIMRSITMHLLHEVIKFHELQETFSDGCLQ